MNKGIAQHLEDTEPMTEDFKLKILEAYKSFEKPDFAFEREEVRQKVYEPFLRDLAAFLLLDVLGFFRIANVTDVNSDHGYVFMIDGGGEWYLQLSFVGRYAALLRVHEGKILDVVGQDVGAESPTERHIVRLLSANDICLLDRDQLEAPIPLILFDTEPANVKVYQALFSDRDVLPWRVVHP